jgi:hypothetical protein
MDLRVGVSEKMAAPTLLSADPCAIDPFWPTSLVGIAFNVMSSLYQVSKPGLDCSLKTKRMSKPASREEGIEQLPLTPL